MESAALPLQYSKAQTRTLRSWQIGSRNPRLQPHVAWRGRHARRGVLAAGGRCRGFRDNDANEVMPDSDPLFPASPASEAAQEQTRANASSECWLTSYAVTPACSQAENARKAFDPGLVRQRLGDGGEFMKDGWGPPLGVAAFILAMLGLGLGFGVRGSRWVNWQVPSVILAGASFACCLCMAVADAGTVPPSSEPDAVVAALVDKMIR